MRAAVWSPRPVPRATPADTFPRQPLVLQRPQGIPARAPFFPIGGPLFCVITSPEKKAGFQGWFRNSW